MFFERLLIAVVSIVVAAIVVSLFVRALRGPDVIATTVGADPEPVDEQTASTDFVPVTFLEGPCAEEAPPAAEGLSVLSVFYTCGNATAPTADAFVYRRAPETNRVLGATLNELLQGPSPNEATLGFRSVFSVASAGTLESATIESGEAVVDFASLPSVVGIAALNNIDFFVANLNANVFQFESISSVEYRLDGSCVAFWEHLGEGTGCRVVARENFESTMAQNRAQ